MKGFYSAERLEDAADELGHRNLRALADTYRHRISPPADGVEPVMRTVLGAQRCGRRAVRATTSWIAFLKSGDPLRNLASLGQAAQVPDLNPTWLSRLEDIATVGSMRRDDLPYCFRLKVNR